MIISRKRHAFFIFAAILFFLAQNAAFAFGNGQGDGKNSATPRQYSVHDSNGDGFLDRAEFAGFLEKRKNFFRKQGKKNRTLSASLDFDRIDQDKNDLIDEAELIGALNVYLQEQQKRRRHKSSQQ